MRCTHVKLLKMPPPGQATLWEDSVKVLCSGRIGKQIQCSLSARGVLGSFQKNRELREHPAPCGSCTQAQVLQNLETQKLSSSTSLNTAKSNSGLENSQSRCNQTDIPTVFPFSPGEGLPHTVFKDEL